MDRTAQYAGFITALRDWFSGAKRTLPWRDLKIKNPTERAYRILVSEVMLQQTQVPRVIIIYKSFLERFPTLASLAAASNRDVLMAWRGMGYNSRALRLRDAAKAIIERRGLEGPLLRSEKNPDIRSGCSRPRKIMVPETMEELTAIPGIGHYTAAAIRNFAFDLPTPCLDTNIRRILHRMFFGPEKGDGEWRIKDRTLLVIANILLLAGRPSRRPSLRLGSPQGDTAVWHAALMDFGSLMCTKRSPKCSDCPMRAFCKSAGKVKLVRSSSHSTEPGRIIGSRFVPNRIVRGRIIEELRDAEHLTLADIGQRVCIDWSLGNHRAWLKKIIASLKRDRMISERRGRFILSE